MHASPSQLVAALTWRYATKKFDPARVVPAETWAALEQALVLSPSSYGLQPWKFIIVTDPALKEQLSAASYGQTQPRDCSHFVVLTVRRDLDQEHVDRYVTRMAEVTGSPASSLAGFRSMVAGSLEQARTAGRLDTWQTHQIYIALGQFMAAAALLGVDTCPMEGIQAARYDGILGLTGSKHATVVACAAGYRASDDRQASRPKVRFLAEDVIERR